MGSKHLIHDCQKSVNEKGKTLAIFPVFGPDWSIRFQIQLLLPESLLQRCKSETAVRRNELL